jgi:hypothetical protein
MHSITLPGHWQRTLTDRLGLADVSGGLLVYLLVLWVAALSIAAALIGTGESPHRYLVVTGLAAVAAYGERA